MVRSSEEGEASSGVPERTASSTRAIASPATAPTTAVRPSHMLLRSNGITPGLELKVEKRRCARSEQDRENGTRRRGQSERPDSGRSPIEVHLLRIWTGQGPRACQEYCGCVRYEPLDGETRIGGQHRCEQMRGHSKI